jgi:Tol biopolymer transport system component
LPGGERILEQDRSDFQNERLVLIDLPTGKRTNVKMPKGMATFGLGVSPDGRQFTWTISDDMSSYVMLYDLNTEQTTALATAKKFAISGSTFTGDGKHVAYQTNDGGQFLKFVSIADKKELVSIRTTGAKITFSPGGVFWARATGNNVYLHAWEDVKK